MEKCKLLVIDDHPIVRSGVSMLVSNEPDFEVVAEAESPSEALAVVSGSKPEIDLIILDLTMGGNDGLELLRQIRSVTPHTPILVYSMNDELIWGERAVRAGAKGYVAKDEEMSVLLKAMKTVYSGELALSENLQSHLIQRLSGGTNPGRIRDGFESLTDREIQVLNLIGTGRTTGEIAKELELSPKTIGAHREHIKTKLGLRSSAELASEAVRLVNQGSA
jgi:two-component system response regulator NreC